VVVSEDQESVVPQNSLALAPDAPKAIVEGVGLRVFMCAGIKAAVLPLTTSAPACGKNVFQLKGEGVNEKEKARYLAFAIRYYRAQCERDGRMYLEPDLARSTVKIARGGVVRVDLRNANGDLRAYYAVPIKDLLTD
jgi:hypothetical protein